MGYDEEVYLLDKELKFTEDLYSYSQYHLIGYEIIIYLVDLNGNIILNGINTNIKFKFGIHDLIISDKNIIYKVRDVYDEDGPKMQEIGKLKLLYVNKNKKRIAILLDDGKTIELSFSYDGLQNIDF